MATNSHLARFSVLFLVFVVVLVATDSQFTIVLVASY